jgi:hypothetical protein
MGLPVCGHLINKIAMGPSLMTSFIGSHRSYAGQEIGSDCGKIKCQVGDTRCLRITSFGGAVEHGQSASSAVEIRWGAGREKRKAYLEFDGAPNWGDPASYGSTEHALQIVLNDFLVAHDV